MTDAANYKATVPAAGVRVPTADSFVNFMTRTGYGAGSQQDSARYQFDYVSRNRIQMEAAYRSNWLAGMAVDAVAQDMTREGVRITSDIDPEDKAKIHRAEERLGIWEQLQEEIKWSRLYGGAIAVLMIDGQDTSTPLNIDSVAKGQFKGLMVFDRWQLQPSLNDLVTELGPDFGLPKQYRVIRDAQALPDMTIHHSRCIRLNGVDLPYWQAKAENLWGQSVLERCWDRLIAFDSSSEGAAQLVYKAHLRTVKIDKLREVLGFGTDDMKKGLYAQMDMMRQYQQNEGLTLLDGADEFDTHAYAFSGLSDVILQFGQQMSGALQIPLVRLFGQSPAGLNSTGESDLRTYYDNVKQAQEKKLRLGMHKVYECISRSELGKPLGDDFAFEFISLWQMTEPEKATVASTVGTLIGDLEERGTITHEVALNELKNLSTATGVFGSISQKDIEDAKEEAPEPSEFDIAEPPKPEPIKPQIPNPDNIVAIR